MSALTIFATGDLHVCDRPSLAGMRPRHARTGEPLYLVHARQTLRWIHTQATQAKAGAREVAVLVGGDLFDTPAPSPAALAVVIDWLVDLTLVGAQVFLLLGNHDRESGSDRPHALEPLRKVRPGQVHVVDHPHLIRLPFGVTLYPIPYPSRAAIAAWPGVEDIDGTNEALSQALNAIVQGYSAQAAAARDRRPGATAILWGHGTLGGASFGSRMVPLSDPQVNAALQHGFDHSLWSHIHLRQQIGGGEGFSGYIGAPDRHDFGEGEQPAGILRLDIDPGQPDGVAFIENPAPRRFVTFDADQVLNEAWQASFRAQVERELADERTGLGPDGRRTVARVVGQVEPEAAAQVAAAVRSLKAAGALIVDRTEVVRASRARVDVGTDFNTNTVLEAVFAARPDLGKHAETIRGRVAALEAQHARA